MRQVNLTPIDDPFWQGYHARLAGETLDVCPYPSDTPDGAAWLDGYEFGRLAEGIIDEEEDDDAPRT